MCAAFFQKEDKEGRKVNRWTKHKTTKLEKQDYWSIKNSTVFLYICIFEAGNSKDLGRGKGYVKLVPSMVPISEWFQV